jgi:AcrR family transcriptional regulator
MLSGQARSSAVTRISVMALPPEDLDSEYCSKKSDTLKVEPLTVTPATQKKPRRLNRAEKREANRDRILRAARGVFGSRGFHGATIEEIADEAGLSNGAIYYNFESKGDLFLELLDERMEERVRHMRRTLTSGEARSRDNGLDEEARDATRSFKESREWRLLLFEFVGHAARDPKLKAKLRAHKRRFRKELGEILQQRFTGGGTAAPMPGDQMALAAMALANGLAFEEVGDPGAVPDEMLGDLLGKLLPS